MDDKRSVGIFKVLEVIFLSGLTLNCDFYGKYKNTGYELLIVKDFIRGINKMENV